MDHTKNKHCVQYQLVQHNSWCYKMVFSVVDDCPLSHQSLDANYGCLALSAFIEVTLSRYTEHTLCTTGLEQEVFLHSFVDQF